MASQPQEDLSDDDLEAFGLDEQPGDDAGNDDDGGSSDEELARSLGWKPKDEFTDKDKWVDFPQFLKAHDENLGLARNTNKRLTQINRDLTKKLKRADAMIEQVKGFEERAYKRALADLKAQQEQAVEDGDTAKYRALDKEIDDLRNSAPKSEAKQPKVDNDVREVFTEWLIDNQWYNSDKTKQAYADLQFEKLGGIEGYEGGADELLEEVTRRVEERFKGSEKPKINRTGGANGMRVPPKGDATYASLSPEEKQMAQQMVKAGIFKSTDEYAKELKKNG